MQSRPVCRLILLAVIFLASSGNVGSVLSKDVPESTPREQSAESIIVPQISIVSTTRIDGEVSFSCQITNLNSAPIQILAYRHHSSAPQAAEIHRLTFDTVEYRQNGVWRRFRTARESNLSLDRIEIGANQKSMFEAKVPMEPTWEAVRIGVNWTRSDAGDDQALKFSTAWSESLNCSEINQKTTPQPQPEVAEKPTAVSSARGLHTEFALADFSQVDFLQLLGEARSAHNRLRLTPARRFISGAAWYPDKVSVAQEFETTFQFQVKSTGPEGKSSDGFAFVIQNDSPAQLKTGGGGLGYDGLRNSLAIEFDTHVNDKLSDPNSSHISLHTNGKQPNSAHEESSRGVYNTDGWRIDDGKVHTMRIVYSEAKFSVFADSRLAMTVDLDLAQTLELDHGRAWIGFTGASGGTPTSEDILNWRFSANANSTLATE